MSWFRAAMLRAVRTAAQTSVALIGTAVVVAQVDWVMVLSASGLAGLLSMLTSVATGLPESTIDERVDRAVRLAVATRQPAQLLPEDD